VADLVGGRLELLSRVHVLPGTPGGTSVHHWPPRSRGNDHADGRPHYRQAGKEFALCAGARSLW